MKDMKVYSFICRGQILQTTRGRWEDMKPIAAKLFAEQQADISIMELKGTMAEENSTIVWKHEAW